MKELFFNTIQEFNDYIGEKTLHPLVSVVRVENASPIQEAVHHYGLYALFLKENKGCKLSYGRTPETTGKAVGRNRNLRRGMEGAHRPVSKDSKGRGRTEIALAYL